MDGDPKDAVIVRLLGGWRPHAYPPDPPQWRLLWGPGARERQSEPMSKAEEEIVNSHMDAAKAIHGLTKGGGE